MSEEELVAEYAQGRIPRRRFVRLLVAGGVSVSSAMAYANALAGPALAVSKLGEGAPLRVHHQQHRPMVSYFVNGVPQQLPQNRLTRHTVAAILANAGFVPASAWVLHRVQPPRDFRKANISIRIVAGESFTVRPAP